MARIIVTGGAGFIGSHLVDALTAKRHQVLVVDDLSAGRRENLNDDVQLIREDIRSDRMKDVFRDYQPQYVFHLAAQKNVRTSVADPLFDADVNIAGSLNVIEQAIRFRTKKFVFSSTGGAIYGDTRRVPSDENVPPVPESPYGIAKFTIEQYLRFFRRARKLDSVSLRYANVYGPRQDPKGEAGVVAIFAERLLQRQPLLINGDGKQTRDYVYVSDVVEANLAAVNARVSGDVNIGTGKQTSVNALAKAMIKLHGRPVRVRHRPALEGEVMRSALRWNRAKKQLKWKPRIRLTEGLQRTIESFTK